MSNEVFMAREIAYNEELLAEKWKIIHALRKEIKNLTAENERLRKALLVAADNLEYWGGYVDSDIAIAALEGREPPIK